MKEYDFWLTKLDGDGAPVWGHSIPGAEDNQAQCGGRWGENGEWGAAVRETEDGGFVMLGASCRGHDLVLIKADAEGGRVWERLYLAPSDADEWNPDGIVANDLLLDDDGGFLLVGSVVRAGERRADAWIIKTDAEGNVGAP